MKAGELSGQCMCGAVAWSYSGSTTRNLVCYCADCRRATGSPLTAFLGCLSAQLTWTGAITHYESSPGVQRGFCPVCGTRLYFRSLKWPTETHVHAATMSDPAAYRPDAQVLMRSRLGWLDQLGTLPAHDGFQREPAATTPQ